MYNLQSTITISPVANGFLLTLPQLPLNPSEEMMRMIPGLQKALNRDEALSEIENRQRDADDGQKIVRDNNSFVFKTMRELIAFLEVTFEEE